MLRGHLDLINLAVMSGWVQDTIHPDEPVSLIVTSNGSLIARVLANRYRDDLKDADVGSGRHGFELLLPQPLSPFERHVVRICQETDGSDIPGSPVTLEPSVEISDVEKQYFAKLLSRLDARDDILQTIEFLSTELDRLRQRLADHQSRRSERSHIRDRIRRGAARSPASGLASEVPAAPLAPRALVIDDRVPESGRDAGSNAVLAHMESLQRLGYEVVFVPADQFSVQEVNLAALDAIQVTCYRPPAYGSVEEILRRQAQTFDVIYLHRVSNASKYLTMARNYFPKARLIYSVADLHHIRFARQAVVEDRPELAAVSKRVKLQEYAAAAMSDAVITHSDFEADILRKEIRGVNVHVVPWSIAGQPTKVSFAKRRGLAFIGGFAHQPNRDAAVWLVSEIMPIVRRHDPEIECLLVGSEMPGLLTELCGDGVIAMGRVEELSDIFDRVRLTVAPLTFGAGIKGKVLESMAAGVPCVCTSVAAEGLDLPVPLRECVADDAEGLAAAILRSHSQRKFNQACRTAGLEYMAKHYSVEPLDRHLGMAIGPLR